MKCARVPFLAMALASAACVRSPQTTVTVHDPAQVSVTGRDAPAPAPMAVVPAPGEPLDLGHGELPTGHDTHSSYALRAVRRPDGRVDLEWTTGVALSTGATQTLPDRDEVIKRDVLATTIVGDTSHPASFVRYPCAEIVRHHASQLAGRAIVSVPTGLGPALDWDPCAPDAMVSVPLLVSTPWSNVTIRERVPLHQTLWNTVLVSSAVEALALVTGAVLLIDGLAASHRGEAIAGGATLGGGGLLLGARLVVTSLVPFEAERVVPTP